MINFTNKELLEQIKLLLKDENWNVRYSAIKVFGKLVKVYLIFVKDVLEQIKPLLQDEESLYSLESMLQSDLNLLKDVLEQIEIIILKDKYYNKEEKQLINAIQKNNIEQDKEIIDKYN